MTRPANVPLHEWIASDLRRRIADGEWQPDTRLPSMRDLAARYQCSEMPVRQALMTLRAHDLVYEVRGIGYFVAPLRESDHGQSPGRTRHPG